MNSIVAKIVDISTPAIVQGEDAFVITQVSLKDSGDPYSFHTFVSSSANFAKADGTTLTIQGSLQSADLGTVKFVLAQSDTLLLLPGEELDVEQYLYESRGLSILQIVGKLTVAAKLL